MFKFLTGLIAGIAAVLVALWIWRAQEKPYKGVMFGSDWVDRVRGKPIIVKGEKVFFTARAFKQAAPVWNPPNGSLVGASFVKVESIGSGAANITVTQQDEDLGLLVEGKQVGDSEIRFELKSGSFSGTIIGTDEVRVIDQLDEFEIHFHFVRANRDQQNTNIAVGTMRATDAAGVDKREAVVKPMLIAANTYLIQAGLKFTATHGVTSPASTDQDLIDDAFDVAGRFKPPASKEFFQTFNKVGKINVYLVRSISDLQGGESTHGVTMIDVKEPATNEAVYQGGRLVKKAFGIVLSDAATPYGIPHELGHMLGLKDQLVIKGDALNDPPRTIGAWELDAIDALNHRVESKALGSGNHNLMRGPFISPAVEPKFLFISEGQALHGRGQLETLKWSN